MLLFVNQSYQVKNAKLRYIYCARLYFVTKDSFGFSGQLFYVS